MSQAYLEPSRTSTIKLSSDFCKEAPPQMFYGDLNIPLHTFTYRSVP